MKNKNNLYNSNVINQYSDISHKEDINFYKDYNNFEEKQIKNNRYNITNNNNINNSINYINNDIPFLGSQEKKKAHTSFDIQPGLPGLKNKLDIIHEEDEDDNKYITDFQINNLGKDKNLNTLEILMKQRMFYQNQMPNNSRFKIKLMKDDYNSE